MSGDVSRSAEEGLVPLTEAAEQVRKACERLALLHYAFAKTLVDELGDDKGRQMVMNAIKLYGVMVGEEVKGDARAQGLDTSPENYGRDLPMYGMHERTEVVREGDKEGKRVHGCVMGQKWRDLGADDLGRLYCYVDPCKYMAYNPDFKLVHRKALPDGNEYCEMIVEPTTEQDREEFSARNPDLAKLEE
jgi:hypothetical protein